MAANMLTAYYEKDIDSSEMFQGYLFHKMKCSKASEQITMWIFKYSNVFKPDT